MNPDTEMAHLIDLMPASGRMYCKLVSKPDQTQIIAASPPLPWDRNRAIAINFDLWADLPQSQRDMLLLRTVVWATAARWFKVDWQRGLALVGALGSVVELVQGDAVGVVAAGALTGWAGWQIWKENQSSKQEIEADETAVQFALRRGYSEQDAARHLMGAIESVARIENRFPLNFVELLRVQNLRAIAGLSAVSIPDDLR
ncbi:DUF3318 domain-containing protein [Leptolyngbya sp. FACHB-16]|nr:DUF3318 domain-containing protein [Leptolyngbya sp. FACHB-8]MBD2157047.1 DUF3318 domain-containing protein [Leptolyngbya sp. FACHB-16]